ncbi:site-specific integrase [Dietzia cinnamea]|uniref:site-specific integrase n=1 Tax=Dietzia cinnamea TaxID=321318 RepID=UPI0021AF1628|nr:site-specific integrase [Dietzia cinnamea]MCT2062944.1 site-specific integrase [Dietzia cinnamea]MCT2237772.1 site-specific integrase [Dietzia cinnamea]
MNSRLGLRIERDDHGWVLAGSEASRFQLVNEYLLYLLDRNYSPATVRAYGYDLLAFCRWLLDQDLDLASVITNDLLDYLRVCREATVPGRVGPNVVTMTGERVDRYAATTINGAWRRSRACTPSLGSGIRTPSIPSREVARHGGWSLERGLGCSPTPGDVDSPARRCDCGRRERCRWRCLRRMRRPWSRVCGRGETGRSRD